MKQLPYSRADRVADQVQKVVATFFYQDHFDDRLQGINVTGIRMTKDLRVAYVYYFITGDAAQRGACSEALQEIKGTLRKSISDQIQLKFAPDLKFFFDESIERGERIDQLLADLKRKESVSR